MDKRGRKIYEIRERNRIAKGNENEKYIEK